MKTTTTDSTTTTAQHTQWYVASTGNHQGLVIDENTGRNIAVAYDKNDAPLLAAAPDLLAACQSALALLEDPDASGFDADRMTAMLTTAIQRATA